MEGNVLFKWGQPRVYRMEKNGLIRFGAKRIRIECVSGDIWITWPGIEGGKERTLQKGDSMEVISKGMICANALTCALVRVQRLGFAPFGIFSRIGISNTLGAKLICGTCQGYTQQRCLAVKN